MNNYVDNYAQDVTTSSMVNTRFTGQVFGWMTLGLFITTVIAFITAILLVNPQYTDLFIGLVPFAILTELAVVFILSIFWRRLNGIISLGLFLFYSALNGIVFGLIISYYTASSIFMSFGITAVVFLALAIYGLVTKKDLTNWGNIAIFGLFGLIIASVFNIFIYFFSPGLANGFGYILNYLGVIIFIVLIAFDAQKIKRLALMADKEQAPLKYSIQGALSLYLDFINLFIRILTITGKRRR